MLFPLAIFTSKMVHTFFCYLEIVLCFFYIIDSAICLNQMYISRYSWLNIQLLHLFKNIIKLVFFFLITQNRNIKIKWLDFIWSFIEKAFKSWIYLFVNIFRFLALGYSFEFFYCFHIQSIEILWSCIKLPRFLKFFDFFFLLKCSFLFYWLK